MTADNKTAAEIVLEYRTAARGNTTLDDDTIHLRVGGQQVNAWFAADPGCFDLFIRTAANPSALLEAWKTHVGTRSDRTDGVLVAYVSATRFILDPTHGIHFAALIVKYFKSV